MGREWDVYVFIGEGEGEREGCSTSMVKSLWKEKEKKKKKVGWWMEFGKYQLHCMEKEWKLPFAIKKKKKKGSGGGLGEIYVNPIR